MFKYYVFLLNSENINQIYNYILKFKFTNIYLHVIIFRIFKKKGE